MTILSKPLTAQPTAIEQHGQLRVEGNRILGEHGEPVVLRGASLFWSQWMGQFYNYDAVQWLQEDWNCSIVRAAMGVEMGGYLENPQIEKAKVTAVVEAAIDLGLYVIIDWHDHNAHQHQAQAQQFFAEMAQRYGEYPNVLYEIWNEPLAEHSWAGQIKPYHTAVIGAIRQHDPDNIILCGSRNWSQKVDEVARDPLPFTNIAYSLHYYAASHKQALRDNAAAALQSGIALMVTEFGVSESSGTGKLDIEETEKWWRFMEENQISWCNWSIADKDETSAALRPGADGFGGWRENELTPSGLLVRRELRRQPSLPDAQETPDEPQ